LQNGLGFDATVADATCSNGGVSGSSQTGFIFLCPVCDDNNACTTDVCDQGTGVCSNTPITCNDNNACTTDTCNPATGCVFTPITCNDNNACTTDTCNPATGCVFTPITCNDNNVCTTDTCDPASGCVFTPNDQCGIEICRTPGFWQERAGMEKAGSRNLTMMTIVKGGGCLEICGEII